MSYILDALKKADAERDQGAVPGLHSRHELPNDSDDDEPRRLSPMLWVGAGVALTLLLVLAWQWWQRPALRDGGVGGPGNDAMLAEHRAEADQAMHGPSNAPMDRPMGHRPGPGAVSGRLTDEGPQDRSRTASPAPQADEHPPPPHPSQTGQARQDLAPERRPPPLQSPQPEQSAPRQIEPPRGTATRPTTEAPAPAAAPAPAPSPTLASPATRQPAAAANPGAPAVPDVHALPENLRRELPNLTIGGAMYSDTRANRMLVLNNQVFHEGDQPAPGLVLEEIRLKSAVFNYRGTRYSVNY